MWKHEKGLHWEKLLIATLVIIGISCLLSISCTRPNGSTKVLVATYDPDREVIMDLTPSLSVSADGNETINLETPDGQSTSVESTSTPFRTAAPIPEDITPTIDFISPVCSPLKNLSLTDLQTVVSQPYNVPNPYSDFGHHGVDLGSYDFHGQYMYEWPVQAVLDGRVAGLIQDRPPLGNAIIIETPLELLPSSIKESLPMAPGESIYHMYAHLIQTPDFELGEAIDCGEVIGQLGNSRTVEAHLHLEMRIGSSGMQIPSMAFYDTATTEEERQTYLWWRTSGDFMPFDPMLLLTFLNSEQDRP
jgi:murein DD-endopeptidase MepM/ murein hydrolase activator NlpD